jgi:DNA repair exonuclease SbcCD ATPase subunit
MISLEQVRALEDRVEKAVAYIAALRSENAEMERRLSEDKSRVDEAIGAAEARAAAAEAKLAAALAKAEEAAAARDAALERIREFEVRLSDMAERVAAAEARAAEMSARADEYRKDQARIEEGIIHALEKLDSFEDLILSQPLESGGAQNSGGSSQSLAAAETKRAAESPTAGLASGIAVKSAPKTGAVSAESGGDELDIF